MPLPLNDDPFDMGGRKLPDLKDPKELCEQMEMAKGGLIQQVEASKMSSAMGGHPNPAHLYRTAAEIFDAAIAFVSQHIPKAEPAKPADPPKPEPVKEHARAK
jgi:hypothetical protein